MYKKGLRKALNVGGAFETIEFRRRFAKEHPYYFEPCGTLIFSGPQGSGKTLSAVDYVTRCLKDYPLAILCTNTAFTDMPFNCSLADDDNGGKVVVDNLTGDVVTPQYVADRINRGDGYYVCIEYTGLDCLKYVNNGEYGVIFFIDEFHLELNSLESKNIDIDVMVEISQQRKQRKHIVGTSQVFMRLAKPLREQIKDVVACHCLFGCFQYNVVIDGEKSTEEDGKLKAVVKGRSFFFHTPKMYSRYDTYAKMKRYNQEWQGRARTNNFDLFKKEI